MPLPPSNKKFLLDKISAVEVNGHLAQISDHVNPGDVVEVITHGPRLIPMENWLTYCNPSTARLLRVVLATESLKAAAEQGRQAIKNHFIQPWSGGIGRTAGPGTDKTDNLLEQLSCASLEDLYAAVGGGAIRLEDVVAYLDRYEITKKAWVG